MRSRNLLHVPLHLVYGSIKSSKEPSAVTNRCLLPVDAALRFAVLTADG